MKYIAVLMALCLSSFAPAIGQANNILSAEELRQEFYGVRLHGVESLSGSPWTECINPDGYTVYKIEDYRQNGFLTIKDDAQACFTYDGRTSCFDVERTQDGYNLHTRNSYSIFTVTHVDRGVANCEAPKLSVDYRVKNQMRAAP